MGTMTLADRACQSAGRGTASAGGWQPEHGEAAPITTAFTADTRARVRFVAITSYGGGGDCDPVQSSLRALDTGREG